MPQLSRAANILTSCNYIFFFLDLYTSCHTSTQLTLCSDQSSGTCCPGWLKLTPGASRIPGRLRHQAGSQGPCTRRGRRQTGPGSPAAGPTRRRTVPTASREPALGQPRLQCYLQVSQRLNDPKRPQVVASIISKDWSVACSDILSGCEFYLPIEYTQSEPRYLQLNGGC